MISMITTPYQKSSGMPRRWWITVQSVSFVEMPGTVCWLGSQKAMPLKMLPGCQRDDERVDVEADDDPRR